MTNLIALAERCEAATGPDEDLSQAIYDMMVVDFGFVPDRSHIPYPGYHYTASLDAAMTLVGGDWFATLYEAMLRAKSASDLPRFLCGAALRAHAGEAA